MDINRRGEGRREENKFTFEDEDGEVDMYFITEIDSPLHRYLGEVGSRGRMEQRQVYIYVYMKSSLCKWNARIVYLILIDRSILSVELVENEDWW